MLSSIVELPPKLRMSYLNIVTHFLIGRSDPNLEFFVKENNNSISAGLFNRLYLPNIKKWVITNLLISLLKKVSKKN